MKIAFFELEAWEEEYIRKALKNHDLFISRDKLTKDNLSLVKDAEILSTFIFSILNKEILSQLPNLKYIVTLSTGFDHIDTKFCKEKGIIVSNVPSYGEHTVAEHTFALILALSRKLIPSIEQTKRGDFSLEGLRGFSLYGKTLGVIGAGHIGKRVIEIAKCFGMKVLIFTKHQKGSVSLEQLLSSSDVITIHVPYNSDTHHLINMKNIRLFKKGSMLINTSRGGIVETQAILEGLERGILMGAGLDVLEEECNLREEKELLTNEFLKSCDIKTQLLNHVLLTRNDVIVTPHNAFNSREALLQILETTVLNIQAFETGKPRNTVV